MTEADYIRATDRVIGILEDDEDIKELAMSENREKYLADFIKAKFENSSNLLNAVLSRLDTSFKQNYGNRHWRGLTLNQVLDGYKQDELQRDEKDKQKGIEDKNLEGYDNREKSIREKFERRKEEAISRFEKQIIERQEKDAIVSEQRKLSGAERVRLFEEGRLIK